MLHIVFAHFGAPARKCLKGEEKTKQNNPAYLMSYLIATRHHLCLRFPLLVFWDQTKLISRLALIRGHISEHSGASHAACWEKWNSINQSGCILNVADGGKQMECWWRWRCGKKKKIPTCPTQNKKKQKAQNKQVNEALQMCLCFPKIQTQKELKREVLWGLLQSDVVLVFCCINSHVSGIYISLF